MALKSFVDTDCNNEANWDISPGSTERESPDRILSCLSNICLNENLADVYFSFPGLESKLLPAHKMVLSMRSPVFKAMFYGNIPLENEVIEILDIKPRTFKFMLRYMYTDKTELTGNNFIKVLYAADKYQIQSLLILCENYMHNKLCVGNACSVYSYAKMFSMEHLRQCTLQFISTNAKSIFEEEDFLSISADCLVDILKLETISITEIEVFISILKWVDTKLERSQKRITGQNRREILFSSGTLYLMALPELSLGDFTKIVVPTGILTDEEQLQLFKAITMNEVSVYTRFRIKPRRSADIIEIPIVDIISSLQNTHLNVNSPSRRGNQMNENHPLYRTQNVHFKASRNIKVVSASIKPKFVRVRPDFKCTVTCTVRGKRIHEHFTNGENCTMQIEEGFSANDNWNIVFEVTDDQIRLDMHGNATSVYGHSVDPTVQFQMLPNKHTKSKVNRYVLPGNNTKIDFVFEGICLIDTLNVLEID